MGTVGTRARNGKRQAPRGLAYPKAEHPAVARLAAALREHKAAVEQQAATAEILRAMSGSPGDAQPVFEAIVEKAHRLCAASYSVLYRYDGKLIHFAAAKDVNEKSIAAVRGRYPQPPDRHKLVGRTVLEGKVFHTVDLARDERFPAAGKIIHRRAVVSVPLLRNGAVLGVISCGRAEAKAFTRKEIWLLKTFADQAVIAIENARLFNETKDALEQQTATAEILKVISAAPTATQPVFESIVKKCEVLFPDSRVAVWLVSDGRLVPRANTGYVPEPMPLDRESGIGACVLESRTIHLPDLRSGAEQYLRIKQLGLKHGYLSGVFAPLLREGQAIGAISILRRLAGAFSDKEVALVTTFADQAVIAIENARLFNDTREALERQTAIADILSVISSSPTNIEPVLQAVAEAASRLCRAPDVFVRLIQGELMPAVVHVGAIPLPEETKSQRITPRTAAGRAILECRAIHIPDTTDQGVRAQYPDAAFLHQTHHFKSLLIVPLVRERCAIGTITIRRPETGPFSPSQIKLLQTFADQAVIAIENARLFNETKEALEHQKASADILRIVASSVENADPVFAAITSAGMRLFPDLRVSLSLARDGEVHYVSHSGVSEERRAQVAKLFPRPLDRKTVVAASIVDSCIVHVPDIAAASDKYPVSAQTSHVSGWTAMLAVPLLDDGKAIGCLGMSRATPGPFSDKQIALAQTFADQAVIAIRNASMFRDIQERNAALKESLDFQGASGEILASISSSITDAQPVFDAIVRSLLRLFGTSFATVALLRDGELQLAALHGERGYEWLKESYPQPLSEWNMVGRAILSGKILQMTPCIGNPATPPRTAEVAAKVGFNSIIAAPMVREGKVIGAITTARRDPVPFDDKQVALIKAFADQAVIAIENARLFTELQTSNRELTRALDTQTATSDILRVISRSQTDVQPVFDAIVHSAVRLLRGYSGALSRVSGDEIVLTANTSTDEAGNAATKALFPQPLRSEFPHAQAIRAGTPFNVADARTDGRLLEDARAYAHVRGYRSWIVVPMLAKSGAIGAIGVTRREAGGFNDEEVALLQTFADQAVIAIENARLFNETKEALERQTATAEILRVISASPTDVQPVFDAIVQAADRLCDGRLSTVLRFDGESLDLVAHHDLSAEGLAAYRRVYPQRVSRNTMAGRALLDRKVINIIDSQDDPDIPPQSRAMAAASGFRSVLVVPMLREGEPIGVLNIARAEPGSFSQAQVELLKTFADQAVIAIENVRLFNETKEALEQQTAISEILRVISDSPTDVQPVLDAVAARAGRICDASDARIFLVEGETLRHAAGFGDVPTIVPLGDAMPLNRGSAMGRSVIDRSPVHVKDMQDQSAQEYPQGRKVAEQAGWHTVLAVPLLREGRSLGAIVLRRMEVRPFSDKQISLLKTFADQAAIAIENVRLFNETREALEQQTATSQVLGVISSSPTDVAPTYRTILDNVTRLCDANIAALFLYDGEFIRAVAHHNATPAFAKQLDELRVKPSRETPTRMAAVERRVVHVEDVLKDPAFTLSEAHRQENPRTVLAVPMLREGVLVGVITVWRRVPRLFTEKQVALVGTFANQAVIAIENVRLFNETKESLEQQTAISEVLRVISSSPTDVKPVLDAVAERAARICDASDARIYMVEGQQLRHAAGFGDVPSVSETFPLNPGTPSGKAMIERTAQQVADLGAPSAAQEFPIGHELALRGGLRTVLSVPLLRENRALGTISLRRREVRLFSEKQIALLKTFADQAAIAIENVRLFNETNEALEQQTATAQILGVIASSPSDLGPVMAAVVQNAARLADANHALIGQAEGDNLRWLAAHGCPLPGKPRPITRALPSGRAMLDLQTTQVEDVAEVDWDPHVERAYRELGVRSIVAAPLVREGRAIGVLLLRRTEVRRFTEKQIALLRTFADQAAIAIENVRLFNETREALERQTATAEILKVISDSPTDVQPVFDAILARAAALCNASFGNVFRYDGTMLEMVACNLPAASVEILRKDYPSVPSRGKVSGRVVLDRRVVEVPDVLKDAEYGGAAPHASGHRSLLGVPLLREAQAIGAIVIARHQPGKFSPRQIAMVQTFADQAVIAIENVRLFKELQARTEALTNSVEQLTALGEVGQAISSTLDLETVLKTIVSRAVQLTGLDAGAVYEYDERLEEFHLRAAENMSDETVERLRRTPIKKGDGAVGGTAVVREPIQIPETQDESYKSRLRDLIIKEGRRALLAVPLMRDDHIIGALAVQRNTPGPFAPEVVELLKTFATQSAMAIQNARLFREIAEKGKQLEVASRHKSDFLASMSHELRTPLNALLGFNELILGEVYGEVPADMKPPLAQMQSSGKHLLRLINNVLDLAKIEAGRMELALADYSVHDIVESVRSTLRPLAEEKGLEFLADVPADIPLAHGDAGRITQCLMNLAGNSLKFTKAGKVEISVALDDSRLRYCVADTGIGIPPEKIDSLFTEFKQTDATIASEYGGTGLGLSISKKFVELHGGRIWVESQVGKGSAFSFEVPLRAGTA